MFRVTHIPEQDYSHENEVLIDWTSSDAINVEEWNTLKAQVRYDERYSSGEASHTYFALYINDVLVGEVDTTHDVRYADLPAGAVGVYLSGNQVAAFDNLIVVGESVLAKPLAQGNP